MEQVIMLGMKAAGIPVVVIAFLFVLWKFDKKVEILIQAIQYIRDEIKDLKEGKTWSSRCDDRCGSMEKILDIHESRLQKLEGGGSEKAHSRGASRAHGAGRGSRRKRNHIGGENGRQEDSGS